MARHDCLSPLAPLQDRLVQAVELAAMTCSAAELRTVCGASGVAAIEPLARCLRFDPRFGLLLGMKPSTADPVAMHSVETALLAAFVAGLSA